MMLCHIYLKYSDGSIQIEISPPDTTYTVNETDSVNQINCTADCIPSCTTENWQLIIFCANIQ
jgi:hypothetical protein